MLRAPVRVSTLRLTVEFSNMTQQEMELASHWLILTPGSYWLMFTGARLYTAVDSCMQRSDHLEIELASHWLFFKIPGSYWLVFTVLHCAGQLYATI
jgi:hypothetical protein